MSTLVQRSGARDLNQDNFSQSACKVFEVELALAPSFVKSVCCKQFGHWCHQWHLVVLEQRASKNIFQSISFIACCTLHVLQSARWLHCLLLPSLITRAMTPLTP
jgi:hypothetical protein